MKTCQSLLSKHFNYVGEKATDYDSGDNNSWVVLMKYKCTFYYSNYAIRPTTAAQMENDILISHSSTSMWYYTQTDIPVINNKIVSR